MFSPDQLLTNASSIPANSQRLVMVHHVAGVLHDFDGAIGHIFQPFMEFCQREFAVPPAAE